MRAKEQHVQIENTMQRIIEAALFTPLRNGRWGLPIVFWGPPGVGKTEQIRAVCKRYGLYCEHLAPGERGEGAFGVTPVPEGVNGSMVLKYPPPEWVSNLRDSNDAEQGVVFLDEINTAAPALQPALLGCIQERRVGGYSFGPRVRVIGAANPPEQSAGGWDLAAPVANRLGHIEWPAIDHFQWLDWLNNGSSQSEFVRAADLREYDILQAWPGHLAKATLEVSSFIRRKPSSLFKLAEGKHAWPSPRSWTNAIDALASARAHELGEGEQQVMVSAFVGTAALEFFNWLQMQDLPDPQSILNGDVSWKPNKRKLDEVQVVLEGITDIALRADSQETLGRYWIFLEKTMKECGEDVVMKYAKTMTKTAEKYAEIPAAQRVLKKLGDVIAAMSAVQKDVAPAGWFAAAKAPRHK